jgi:hypothetical protein
MQKFTGKEIIVRKSEVKSLLADALCFHDYCEMFRQNAVKYQTTALFFARCAGIRLLQIKPSIPNGDWTTWLELNFCKPRGITGDWARNYMRIANENEKLISRVDYKRAYVGEVDFELVTLFKFDSQRKYAISFVPEKEQPEHEGNFKFPRLALFANIVNEFERLFNRHVDGLQMIDLDEVREQTKSLYRFLKCVHETPGIDPFTTSRLIEAPPHAYE